MLNKLLFLKNKMCENKNTSILKKIYIKVFFSVVFIWPCIYYALLCTECPLCVVSKSCCVVYPESYNISRKNKGYTILLASIPVKKYQGMSLSNRSENTRKRQTEHMVFGRGFYFKLTVRFFNYI